jgi:hypothetical protein
MCMTQSGRIDGEVCLCAHHGGEGREAAERVLRVRTVNVSCGAHQGECDACVMEERAAQARKEVAS